ncbi:hypothetical protein SY88_16355 [Clostridiales bacterium PH28_bin88]|nr:hypothetical protein SY88_16355 [Clostridiales bacterium PH28_bin88]
MMISIYLGENLPWHHQPKCFFLLLNNDVTVAELVELLGVSFDRQLEIRINGVTVDWKHVVNEGDEIEII